MAKTIICLVLTAVFAFLSLSSYADTDAPRMRQWMAYYEEYQALKALKTLGDRSDDAKMTLLNKLRTMYPEKAAIYETKFKEEFGNVYHTVILIHNDQTAGAHHGTYGNQVVIVNGDIKVFSRDTAAGRSAGLRRLELFAVWDAAADLFDHFTKRGSHRNFYQTGIVDLAA